jgi:hypothetical protein
MSGTLRGIRRPLKGEKKSNDLTVGERRRRGRTKRSKRTLVKKVNVVVKCGKESVEIAKHVRLLY